MTNKDSKVVHISDKTYKELRKISVHTGQRLYAIIEQRVLGYRALEKKIENQATAYKNLLNANERLKNANKKITN